MKSLAYDFSFMHHEFSSIALGEVEMHDIFVFYQSNFIVLKTEIENKNKSFFMLSGYLL